MEGNEEGMNIIIIFSRIRWGVKADGNNSCGVFVLRVFDWFENGECCGMLSVPPFTCT